MASRKKPKGPGAIMRHLPADDPRSLLSPNGRARLTEFWVTVAGSAARKIATGEPLDQLELMVVDAIVKTLDPVEEAAAIKPLLEAVARQAAALDESNKL